MARQNRVTPFGDIIAVAARGTIMGNRGRLHDHDGHVERAWQVKRWLLCSIEFRGRQRIVMAPDRYTELFFLDEATALAAGHRPCFECRRKAFYRFVDAWTRGNTASARPTASELDDRLHGDRVRPDRSKRTFEAAAAALPDGVFVTRVGNTHEFELIWQRRLFAWSAAGYTASRPLPERGALTVLTPSSTVNAIRAGYVPEVHHTVKPP